MVATIRASFRFRARLKLHRLPAYRIARLAGVSPVTLSKLVCGAIEVRPGDERIIAVGRVLGLEPEECFERVNQAGSAAAAVGGRR